VGEKWHFFGFLRKVIFSHFWDFLKPFLVCLSVCPEAAGRNFGDIHMKLGI
jgi:hypothetical protein